MGLMDRASQLLKANVHNLIDAAEDPAVMIKQLIRDMDEAIVGLRRETVRAVAREKQLEKKIAAADRTAGELEQKAVLALEHDNQALARRILAERVTALKHREALAEERTGATSLAERLKDDLVRMEAQAAIARRQKDELIRRQHAAEAQLRTGEAARRSSDAIRAATARASGFATGDDGFGGYADEISRMESEAEAARELAEERDGGEDELRRIVENDEVDRELERLRQRKAAGE